MRNLTKRYIIKSLDGLNLSNPIKYERYYINDNLRIQKKNDKYEKYLLIEDNRISIKKYYGRYLGLYRVEVTFNSIDEEKAYVKESWMGKEITDSPLAFDKYLSKLSEDEFIKELKKYTNN